MRGSAVVLRSRLLWLVPWMLSCSIFSSSHTEVRDAGDTSGNGTTIANSKTIRAEPPVRIALWMASLVGSYLHACSYGTMDSGDFSQWCAFVSLGLDKTSIELW